jgi:hypothetical protein
MERMHLLMSVIDRLYWFKSKIVIHTTNNNWEPSRQLPTDQSVKPVRLCDVGHLLSDRATINA